MTEPTKKEMLRCIADDRHRSCEECGYDEQDCALVRDAIQGLIESMPESESSDAKVVINRSCPIDCRLPHKITLENASEIADKLAEVLRRSRQVKPEDLKKPITASELGGVEAGMTKPLASDPASTGGSIPPSGFLTDEPGLSVISTMDEKALEMLEEVIDWRNHPECQAAVDHLRVRLALLVGLQKDIAVLANGTISLLLERKKKLKVTHKQQGKLMEAMSTLFYGDLDTKGRQMALCIGYIYDILGLEVEKEKEKK
jgi:hypothetical protein